MSLTFIEKCGDKIKFWSGMNKLNISLLIKFIAKPIDDKNLLCLALRKSISLSIIFFDRKLKPVKKDELRFFGGLKTASEQK